MVLVPEYVPRIIDKSIDIHETLNLFNRCIDKNTFCKEIPNTIIRLAACTGKREHKAAREFCVAYQTWCKNLLTKMLMLQTGCKNLLPKMLMLQTW